MSEKHLAQLEKGGLSSAEAQVYLALVRSGTSMSASTIVTATGVPRGSIYPTLTRLTDMGLVEAEAGYGGRFSAIPAERALPSLIVREREELSQREQILNQLTKELKSVAEPAALGGDAKIVQVLRDPRVTHELFDRLRLEARQQIQVFVKAPIFTRDDDPVQEKVLRRGVEVKGVYERAALDVPAVKAFLGKWIKQGEQARVYDGELPQKLAIFDGQTVLMPLVTPGAQMRALVVRHPQLAHSLSVLFDFFWERSEPVIPPDEAANADRAVTSSPTISESGDRLVSNHHRRRSIRKRGSA